MPDITYQISSGTVITVPIDTTLSVSGQAADAKATGDALALKANRSELGTAIKVNNQTADAGGNILVSADEITLSDSSTTTVADQLTALAAKAGDTIKYTEGSADTIKEKIDELDVGKASASAAVPLGGSAGQVLGKRTASDLDLAWVTPSSKVCNVQSVNGNVPLTATAIPVNSATGAISVETALGQKGKAPMAVLNTSIATTAWASSDDYDDFEYKAVITVNGVTANDYAEVVFDPSDALSGNYAPVCVTGANTVTIYAADVPESPVVIPTIMITKL